MRLTRASTKPSRLPGALYNWRKSNATPSSLRQSGAKCRCMRMARPIAIREHAAKVNRPLMRRHALFVRLLILFAAARFAILLTSQTHVHSDEAIIGLIGKHILEGRYFPCYMYGQAYNAG